mmetsp:Transcript_61605/g.149112  ORF Transcript_61605/g.149112 Transcript_61605/m.149112 type:complete len:629 (-) Transcript_61605:55-1941(-)
MPVTGLPLGAALAHDAVGANEASLATVRVRGRVIVGLAQRLALGVLERGRAGHLPARLLQQRAEGHFGVRYQDFDVGARNVALGRDVVAAVGGRTNSTLRVELHVATDAVVRLHCGVVPDEAQAHLLARGGPGVGDAVARRGIVDTSGKERVSGEHRAALGAQVVDGLQVEVVVGIDADRRQLLAVADVAKGHRLANSMGVQVDAENVDPALGQEVVGATRGAEAVNGIRCFLRGHAHAERVHLVSKLQYTSVMLTQVRREGQAHAAVVREVLVIDVVVVNLEDAILGAVTAHRVSNVRRVVGGSRPDSPRSDDLVRATPQVRGHGRAVARAVEVEVRFAQLVALIDQEVVDLGEVGLVDDRLCKHQMKVLVDDVVRQLEAGAHVRRLAVDVARVGDSDVRHPDVHCHQVWVAAEVRGGRGANQRHRLRAPRAVVRWVAAGRRVLVAHGVDDAGGAHADLQVLLVARLERARPRQRRVRAVLRAADVRDVLRVVDGGQRLGGGEAVLHVHLPSRVVHPAKRDVGAGHAAVGGDAQADPAERRRNHLEGDGGTVAGARSAVVVDDNAFINAPPEVHAAAEVDLVVKGLGAGHRQQERRCKRQRGTPAPHRRQAGHGRRPHAALSQIRTK